MFQEGRLYLLRRRELGTEPVAGSYLAGKCGLRSRQRVRQSLRVDIQIVPNYDQVAHPGSGLIEDVLARPWVEPRP
jgi:hypothetical protein